MSDVSLAVQSCGILPRRAASNPVWMQLKSYTL